MSASGANPGKNPVFRVEAKAPEQRPSPARELKRRWRACTAEAPWSEEDAERWWRTNLPSIAVSREAQGAG